MPRQHLTTSFAELSRRAHLPLTHQRQVIYETLITMRGHPSPEEVYAKVRKRIPSISLAYDLFTNIHKSSVHNLPVAEANYLGSIKVAGVWVSK